MTILLRLTRTRLRSSYPSICTRTYSIASSSTAKPTNLVKIVEVGPRDGLQNEKAVIPPSVKVELINRLGRAGLNNIESGSFVSPKWVPQMAGTAEVISQMERRPGVHYPVLIPNERGLDNLLDLLNTYSSNPNPTSPPPTDEIAIFTSSTDAFSLANTNCTIQESLTRLSPVASRALKSGLRVRGYVSVVITCPYTGRVDYKRVRDVSKALIDMGCYEVSLGDTTGMGTPGSVGDMLEVVTSSISVDKLAGHFHDTYGTALSNIFTSLSFGLRTFDSSIAGLGGCPYSPGATGNVATEDVIYALRDSGYAISNQEDVDVDAKMNLNLDELVDTGYWISEMIGRRNESRVGRALRGVKKRREEEEGK